MNQSQRRYVQAVSCRSATPPQSLRCVCYVRSVLVYMIEAFPSVSTTEVCIISITGSAESEKP